MRLPRFLPIVASVLAVSVALPFAAFGDVASQGRLTLTPTRPSRAPTATRPSEPPTATRIPRIPSPTPTTPPNPTSTRPLVILPTFTATATATFASTLQGGGTLIVTATFQGGGQQAATATNLQGGGQQAATATVVQGGGQLSSTFTSQPGPKSQGGGNFPVPPWLLIVLGAGLLGLAFLGFKLLAGSHPVVEHYGAPIVGIDTLPVEPMWPDPGDRPIKWHDKPDVPEEDGEEGGGGAFPEKGPDRQTPRLVP